MLTSTVYHIAFNSELKTVIGIWKGYSTSPQFREGAEGQLALMVANQVSKMLVDLKEMVLIGSEDVDWMNKTYIPKAIKNGLKAAAVIQPDYYFNKVAVDSILFKINKKVPEVRYFSSLAEAKEWLLNVQV